MLVLSRKNSEKIIIRPRGNQPVMLLPGDQIEITLVDVRGDKARIGVEAQDDFQILRKELVDAATQTDV